jgi:hypothetical protein
MSREDLFGPGGPFGVSGTPATPRGAGADRSGFEPPDAGRGAEPAEATEPTELVEPAQDVDDDRTEVYVPPADRTQVYRASEYEPGQYQPRSMGPNTQAENQQGPYTPGQYQPGQYQPGYQPRESIGYPGDDGSWYGEGGPPPGGSGRRGWLVAAIVAVLVVAAGAIGAYALLGGDGTDTASQTGGTVSPTAGPTPSAEDSAEPEESETAEPTETPEASGAAFEPIPDEPWTAGLDFGFLTKVTRRGDEVRLTFNRATFYYGDEATEKNGGVPPDNDYLIEDTNKRVRTFVLAEGAALEGSTLLGGEDAGPEGREITVDELVDNAADAVAAGSEGIPVWLRHEKGQDSDVTALAEQFVP